MKGIAVPSVSSENGIKKDFFFFLPNDAETCREHPDQTGIKTYPSFLVHAVVINIYKFFWISAWLIDMSPEILSKIVNGKHV